MAEDHATRVTTIHCPECGAPAEFRAATVTRVCEYCDSTIVRRDADIDLVGKVSHLLDTASPILLGSRGSYGGVPFEVAGRLQVQYARGVWNEWYLDFADGTDGWLSDAMGRYAVTRPVPTARNVPAWESLRTGTVHEIGGRSFLVVDRRAASYQGAEGALPFVATPGRTFHAVDLADAGGSLATVDFEDDPRGPARVYLGESVRLAALGLRPLRTFEGFDGR